MVFMQQSTLNELLSRAGYDPTNQHFIGTQERWEKVILNEFAFKPFDPSILQVEFADDFKGMVVEPQISFSSLCAHHLLAFEGVAHIGYLPNGKVVGASKLSRVTEHFTHQITIQEKATREITDAIQEVLQPRGVIVCLEGKHSCMTCRGVRKSTAGFVTTDMRGVFLDNVHGCREEFFQAVLRSQSR